MVPVARALQGALNWFARRQGDLVVIGTALFAIAGEMVGRAIYGGAFEPIVGETEFAWLFRATLQYAPYFLIGVAAYVARSLFEALHRISWPALAIAVALVIVADRLALSGTAATALDVLAEEFATTTAACALLALFRRFLSAPKAWVGALNDSVYSIYLFHYFVIYALAVWLVPIFDPFWVYYAFVAALTGGVAFALHRFIIARSRFLALLFNGKTGGKGGRARA